MLRLSAIWRIHGTRASGLAVAAIFSKIGAGQVVLGRQRVRPGRRPAGILLVEARELVDEGHELRVAFEGLVEAWPSCSTGGRACGRGAGKPPGGADLDHLAGRDRVGRRPPTSNRIEPCEYFTMSARRRSGPPGTHSG